MIIINTEKARATAHGIRRAARSAEFAPLDAKANIPSEAEAAEAARQAVREKYTEIQANINAAADVAELKQIVSQLT